MTPSSHSYGTLVSFPVPDSSQTGPYSDEGEGLISYTIDWIWQKKKKKNQKTRMVSKDLIPGRMIKPTFSFSKFSSG